MSGVSPAQGRFFFSSGSNSFVKQPHIILHATLPRSNSALASCASGGRGTCGALTCAKRWREFRVWIKYTCIWSAPEGRSASQVPGTWTPKVCKCFAVMAFWAISGGFGLLFYILLGSRKVLTEVYPRRSCLASCRTRPQITALQEVIRRRPSQRVQVPHC